MRRSGYLCCLLATLQVSSQPDAAYVPSMRHVSAVKARHITIDPQALH
jgi:hypothetical protein